METVHTKLSDYKPKESKSFYIKHWYNKHVSAWVVQVFDNYDREQKSEYCADSEWRDNAIEDYCDEYNTTDIRQG